MRAAIYARVSTQRQAQAQTIDQQIDQLQEFVADQGWSLDPEHIYRDDGYSGAKLARPGLDSLRDRAAFNEFDVVVILAPDRLARNYVHQMVVMEELNQRHSQVQFVDRPMSDDPHDHLLLQIRGAVAEYERTLITDRMRRGRLRKYKAGQLLPWSQISYGYQVDPDRPRDPNGVTLDEAKSAMVRQMFAWYLEPGATLYRVTKQLTDLGLPTPMGKARWSVSTVRGILTNTAYQGVIYANRLRTKTPTQRSSALQPVRRPHQTLTLRSEDEWIPIEVPAIVDMATFEQVQAKLAQNQQMAPRNNKTHQYLLRGLVSCGLCRLGAYGRSSGSKYCYYVCNGRTDALRAAAEDRCTSRFIPTQQLDDLVWQDLCDVLTQPDIVSHALDRAHGGHWLPQELQSRLQGLGKADKQLQRQKQRLLDAYLAEVLSLEELKRKRAIIEQKLDAIHIQRNQLEATASERLELAQFATSIEEFCVQIRPVLDNASFEQKRQLVELLIDRVIVTDDQVEIRYVIPTRPDGPHVPFCQLRTDYRRYHQRLPPRPSDRPHLIICSSTSDSQPQYQTSGLFGLPPCRILIQ
jgi:site-specific DNA recombinase